VHRLAEELGVHHTTAEDALQLLLREGVLISQGPGRRRLVREGVRQERSSLRVGIMTYEAPDREQPYLLAVRHWLQEAGHLADFAEKSLLDLRMDARRVARYVSELDFDAWLVVAGSREVLRWFAQQSKPAFALFGRRRGVEIGGVGPDKLPAAKEAVDRLVALGHRRIVLLLREEHRLPKPGFFAQSLLDAMEAHGLATGAYNLPAWENHPEDFRRCLDSLFRFVPPTAMIVDEVMLFHAAQQHLAHHGIQAPRQVSLVCNDHDLSFEWSSPSIAHIRWDKRVLIRRVADWVEQVARGKDYRQQSVIKAEFVAGGTIGPAR
jgi:LacI family transcriptional regulator